MGKKRRRKEHFMDGNNEHSPQIGGAKKGKIGKPPKTRVYCKRCRQSASVALNLTEESDE